MRKVLVIAGIFAAAAALSPSAAFSKGKGGMHVSGAAAGSARNDRVRGLARADKAAGTHGLKGRNIARTRGANSPGFCPPGQQKKLGSGSRFKC